jgi:hypothetical protein
MKKLFFVISLALAAPLCFLAAQNVLPGYDGFWDRDTGITVFDILEYYPDQLPYLRNEVYARYGRGFVTKVYQDYFNRQSWYRIRNDYTDDWLSSADKRNAELLRAVEQAPSVADTIALLERNVEYRSSRTILTFGSSGVIEADNNEYFEIYGKYLSSQPYVIIGDWVIVYHGSSSSYDVSAYRIDHRARGITAWTGRERVSAAVFTPLIRAQEKLRSNGR